MYSDLVWKYRFRKSLHLQIVVQELRELPHSSAHPDHLGRLLTRVEVETNMVHAAAGWHDHQIEVAKALCKVRFRRHRRSLIAAVSHGVGRNKSAPEDS